MNTILTKAAFQLILTILVLGSLSPKGIVNAAQTEAERQPTREQYALLVGINRYTAFSELKGCENDVRMMKDLLISKYGFKDNAANPEQSDIKTLLSSSATRDNILAGLRELINKAELHYKKNALDRNSLDKGANIVFFYSGHGGTLPDIDKSTGKLSGEESDGFDETLIPIDAKTDGTNVIIDDELNRIQEELGQWTSNITFIFDSCHSGTVTRSEGNVRRSEFKDFIVPPSAAEQLLKLGVDTKRNGDNSNLTDGISSKYRAGYVAISGSRPNQLSRELELPNPDYNAEDQKSPKSQWNGLLTYYLVQRLRSDPAVTYKTIEQPVRDVVREKNPSQEPQFEGDLFRGVFNIPNPKGLRALSSIPFKKTGALTINLEAGKVIGAVEGGLVALYSAEATTLSDDSKIIGTGRITNAADFTASAEVVLRGDKLTEIPNDAQAVLVTPYFGNSKKTVALDTSRTKAIDTSEVMSKVAETMKKKAFAVGLPMASPLKVQREARTWSSAVVRMAYRDFRFGNIQPPSKCGLKEVPKETEEVFVLTDISDMPLYNFCVSVQAPDAQERIANAIEKHVRVGNIKMLGNNASSLSGMFKMEVVPITAKNAATKTADCVIEPIAETDRRRMNGTEIFSPGDLYYLRITNESEKDMYLYVYSIAADGGVSMIFPQALRSPDRLGSGLSIETLGNRKCYVFYAHGPDESGAPYGLETLKLVATSEKIDGSALESSSISEACADGTYKRGPETTDSPLQQLLDQAWSNSTRKAPPPAANLSDWVTLSLDIEVRKQKP